MSTVGRTGIFPHRIDRTTDANAGIDYAHKEVHSGDSFYHFANAELDTNGTLERVVTTPNTTEWAHMLWRVESQSQITFEIYETVTINDQSYPVFNRNRNFAGGNTTVLWNLLSAAGATLICKWVSGGLAATPFRGGVPADTRSEGELVLKQNEKYLFRITSNTDNNNVNLHLGWYEHTNIE